MKGFVRTTEDYRNKNYKPHFTQVLAFMLSLFLAFTSVDFTAFAAEYDTQESATSEDVTTLDDQAEQGTSLPADAVAFEQSTTIDGIEIAVTAPAGVFPAGASLHVEAVTAESDVTSIENLVTEQKEATDDAIVDVEQSHTFDIAILDADGNEIEPDTTYGEAVVTFKNVGVAEVDAAEEKELSVYYVADDYSSAEEIDSTTDGDADTAVITADHFSIYTVVITSGTAKDTILHYYQGTDISKSYFIIYNEAQLTRYREIVNGWASGKVQDNDSIATILVNSDDANPVEGITGDGQATDMTVGDLNLSAKLMDDITVTSAWSSITKLLAAMSFDGNGHTITFKSLASGLSFTAGNAADGTTNTVLFSADNNGTVKNLTLTYGGQVYTYVSDAAEEDVYATITVRVDGQKAEIGEAITGAEALAASADGKNYITLERDDDLGVYRTLLSNLYPEAEDDKGQESTDELTYDVYYVYEDENETITAASLTKVDYEAELNFVSVTYNLAGCNTYQEESDGTLSEDVMAAVRVDVTEGTYVAQEDYEAVVVAADGFEIPTKEYHVVVKTGGADGTELERGADYTYTYDSKTKRGKIHIEKDKITDKIYVEVEADVQDDKPANKIILKTRGGTITDALWEKESDGTYTQTVYEGQTTTALPTSVTPYKGSDSIKFAGWYRDIASTGTKYIQHSFEDPTSGNSKEVVYYAKWVLAKTQSSNGTVQYYYKNGVLNVSGKNSTGAGQVTYGNNGFSHVYKVGDLTTAQINGTSSADNTSASMVSSVGQDIFVNITGTDLWVAMICTLDSNGLVDVTYLFENRGSSQYDNKLYFGLHADVMIACDDSAAIASTTTSNGVSYMTMTSQTGTYPGQQFRLYTNGSSFGVDQVYSYWYGGYSSRQAHAFSNSNRVSTGVDSGLAFSWYVNNIPAKGYVTRTTKMGMADVSTMSNIVANLHAESGTFSDGITDKSVTSTGGSIQVLEDGRIKTKSSSGNYTTYAAPTRSGYVFSHWSIGSQNTVSVAGKTYTESVELYANWTPKPDRSVTNNSSVQKVNGSDNLLVPSTLGKIVIENTTEGAAEGQTIEQGETVAEAAGYASGFSCILKMDGEDDRYLLPDDVEVTVTNDDGTTVKLTKDTGYTYAVYDNRKKAKLEISKQYITGNIMVTAVGYELPPVTATSVTVKTSDDSISYGERAAFTASAETSKNHVASYQWYIAPYYEITLDNKTYWTYQNQDGIALKNGTNTYSDTQTIAGKQTEVSWNGGDAVTVSGANKATLRISGLNVNTFGTKTGESTDELRFAGYHVYCVVTSTRNITGQEIVAASDVVELEVTQSKYDAPTGLEGSATTYNGSADGEIVIESQSNRAAMYYQKSTEVASSWHLVTTTQLANGKIAGLTSGTYRFKYSADSNHKESDITEVEVAAGRNILVTYKSTGADDTSLRTQYKYVAYGTNVTASTADVTDATKTIATPTRSGYTFTGWSTETISKITQDTVVTAQYTPSVYKITLDNQNADTGSAGTTAIYEKYSDRFYSDQNCTKSLSGVSGITIPSRDGYIFLGYYTEETDGTQLIAADGCLSSDMVATNFLENTTLYAHWEKDESAYVEPDPEEDTTYTITYKDVDGTASGGTFSGQFMSYAPVAGSTGTAVTLPTAVKTGYTFGGWFLKAKGTGKSITSIPVNTKSDIVVYAKWNANKYEITLETNGGSYVDGYTPADQYQHSNNRTKNVALPDATEISRDNYTFLGWYDNADCLGEAITEVDATQVGAKTYYAGWEELPAYPITLTGDGQEGAIYTITGDASYGFTKDGATYVYDGKEYRFTVTPASAYRIKSVKANGKVIDGTDGVYTLSSVTEAMTITVAAERLVSTEEAQLANAVATIALADGTIGYFDSLAAAISYAANYGTDSVIVLQKDLGVEQEDGTTYEAAIDAIAGNAYTIDFNGHTVTDGSLLVEDSAEVTLTDLVNGTTSETLALTVENRGELTNKTTISELLNLGITINDGTVVSMTQQDSESYDKSKFVNNGTVATATLEDGYFVENVLTEAPEGLTGYHTIMNGNEYYVNFNDAVNIANASDSDAIIKVLSTVDNRDNEIVLHNENGHAITVDLNGYNLSSGSIVTDGTVSFVNTVGSATKMSEISASVTNSGTLTIGNFVKLSGASVNEENATFTVEPKATISSKTTNKGQYDNKGNVTGIFTNEAPGQTTNDGTMNNVIIDGGDFINNKDITTGVNLRQGTYQVASEATPEAPSNAVAMTNLTPTTYYGTLQDLADDVNDAEKTSGFDESNPLEITILKDVDNDDFGGEEENPTIVLDPSVPTSVNLNNHTIGSEAESGEETPTLQIGSADAQEPSTGVSVSITNKPTDGTEADASKGKINTPVTITEDSSVNVDGGVSVDQVDNDGSLNLGKGSTIHDLDNSGDTENHGMITTVTQEDGSFTNGEDAVVTEMTQTGGETTNKDGAAIYTMNQSGGTTTNAGEGSQIGELNQTGGTTKNQERATILKLEQNGGNTENEEGSTIEQAEVKKGSYTGADPEKTLVDGEIQEEASPSDGKVAQITTQDGTIIYFTDLNDALNYAANMDESESPVTVTLIQDIADEEITVISNKTSGEESATKVTLDLNGHDIDRSSSITLENGTDLTVTDSTESEAEKGSVAAPITNEDGAALTIGGGVTASGKVVNGKNSQLTVDEGASLTGGLENSGNTENHGTITGGVTQKGGRYENGENAYTDAITQTGGNTVNKNTSTGIEENPSGIGTVTLEKGSFEGNVPTNGITGGVAQIGDGADTKIYGDLESAIKDANEAESDTTIKILEDVELSEDDTIVIDNTNGKNITIDLSGNDITGGAIQVGDGENSGSGADAGNVIFTNSSTPEGENPKGTVSSAVDVKEDGRLMVGDGTSVEGNVNVDGGDLTITGEDTSVNGDVTVKGGGSASLEDGAAVTGDLAVKDTDSEVTIDTDSKVTGNVSNEGNVVNNGTIDGDVTNNGNVINGGKIDGTLNQEEGTVTNSDGGSIGTLNQTGGNVKNESEDASSIGNANISGGEYEGTKPEEMGYAGAKVAVITKDGDGKETTTYYPTLSDALAVVDDDATDVTIKLLDDVTADTEDADASGISIDKAGIQLDLNGHDITVPVVVTEKATDVAVTDTSSEAATEGGKLSNVTIEKGASVTIGESVKAANVSNEGTLDNNGTVEELTNNGTATNHGTLTQVTQEAGDLNNAGEIGTVDLNGGSYTGETPTSPEGVADGAVARIGDKLYATLEDAVADANKAGSNVTIEILQDIEQSSETTTIIGNANGYNITLELGGHTVEGGTLEVQRDGAVKITDTDASGVRGSGSLGMDVTVPEGATLTIDKETTVDGTLTNAGMTNNNGMITDDVVNTGSLSNGKEGIISGDVNNTGVLTNKGNLESDVTNQGNGSIANSGNINGQLVNEDSAKVNNSGSINQVKLTDGEVVNAKGGTVNEVLETGGSLQNEKGGSVTTLKQTGGSTDNSGTITSATVSDVTDYVGKIPESGISDAKVTLTYTDEDGTKVTKYYPTLSDALAEAANVTPATIDVNKDVTVDSAITLPEGVTVNVTDGAQVTITESGSLEVGEGATLTVKEGGSLTSAGKIENNGTIDNASGAKIVIEENGELINKSTFNNGGTLDTGENGKITNSEDATIENKDGGSISGAQPIDNAGSVKNDGQMSTDVDNTKGGTEDYEVSWKGSDGTTYTGSLEDAAKYAEETKEAIAIDLNKDVTVDSAITLPDNVTLNVTDGKNLTIGKGGSLATGEGSQVNVSGGSEITIEKGASLTTGEGSQVNVSDGSGITVGQGGTLTAGENSKVNVTESSKVTVDSNATVKVEEGASVSVDENSSVKNSGTIDNSGTLDVDGSLENAKNATIKNEEGSTITGDGSVVNNGTVDNAGKIENKVTGTGDVVSEVTWVDADGKTHAGSLADALEELAKSQQSGITITVNKDITIEQAVTVPDGVTIDVPKGTTITIADGGSLTTGEGSAIHVEKGAELAIAQGGSLTVEPGSSVDVAKGAEIINAGSVEVDGALYNNGTVTNQEGSSLTTGGTLTNEGTLSNEKGATITVEDGSELVNKSTFNNNGDVDTGENGKVTNGKDATINNKEGGSISGKQPIDNAGSVSNDGQMSTDVDNTKGGTEDYEVSWKGSDGTTYTGSLEDAAKYAEENKEAITIDLNKDVTVDSAISLSENVTLNVTDGHDLTIGQGGSLTTGEGSQVNVSGGSEIIIEKDASLTTGEGSQINVSGGSEITIEKDASLTTGDGSQLNVSDGSDLTVGEGGTLTAGKDSEVNVTEGSKVTVNPDATVKVEEGSTITVDQDSSVKNSGTIENDGTLDVDGSLENVEEATIKNGSESTIKGDGDIVNNGTLDNQGKVETEVTGDGSIEGEVTWTDAGGNTHTGSLADALEELAKRPQGNVTITVNKSVTIDKEVTVPDGVTINVKDGNTIKVTDSGSLTAGEGSAINVEEGAAIDIAQGGSLVVESGSSVDVAKGAEVTNNGTVEIDGTLNNNGTITNDGAVTIEGALNNKSTLNNNGDVDAGESGKITNSKDATITNDKGATISGTQPIDNAGSVSNDGQMSTDVDNTKGGTEDYEVSWKGSDGTTYTGSLEDAAKYAEENNESITIDLNKDVTVDSAITLPDNVTLNVTDGKDLTIGQGGSLTTGEGSQINVSGGSEITIEKDASLTTGEGSQVNVSDGSDLTVGEGGTLMAGKDSEVNVTEGSKVTVDPDATVKIEEGSTITVDQDSSVKNSGTIENDGTLDVDGSLENAEDATIKNGTGSTIKGDGDVVNNGTLDNQGKVETDVTGDGSVEGEVTWTDADGNTHTGSLADALEELAKNPQGDVTITVNKDITIDKEVTVPDGVTINVKDGNTIKVTDGGSLTAGEGSAINVEEGAAIDIVQGGSLVVEPGSSVDVAKGAEVTNDGTVEIDGTLNNNGTIINDGAVTIEGALNNKSTLNNNGDVDAGESGKITNSKDATITNDKGATISGKQPIDNAGSVSNDGQMSTDVDNTKGGTEDYEVSWKGSDGTTYTGSLEDAVKYAEENKESITIDLNKDVTVDSAITLPDNVTLNVTDGKDLTIGQGGSLTTGQGSQINVSGGSEITIEKDASLTTGEGSQVNVSDGSDLTVGEGGTLTTGKDSEVNVTEGSKVTVDPDATVKVEEGATVTVDSDSSVKNSGTIDNDGTLDVDGSLENAEDATIKNGSGSTIKGDGDVVNNGTLDNQGKVETDVTGDGSIEGEATWTDADGNTHSGSLVDALEELAKSPQGNVTITVNKNVTIDKEVTVPDGVTINIKDGNTITVADGGFLTVEEGSAVNVEGGAGISIAEGGSLTVEPGASVDIAKGAEVTNDGNVEIDGTLTNNGTITNDGSVAIDGALHNNGTVTNEKGSSLTTGGTLTNDGTLSNEKGATITIEDDGELVNKSTFNNNGAVDTGENGKITNSEDATIKNKDGGSISGKQPIDNAGSVSNDGQMSSDVDNAKGGTEDYEVSWKGSDGTTYTGSLEDAAKYAKDNKESITIDLNKDVTVDSAITLPDNVTLNVTDGNNLTIGKGGSLTTGEGSKVNVSDGSKITLEEDASLTTGEGSQVNVSDGSGITLEKDASLTTGKGSQVNVSGDSGITIEKDASLTTGEGSKVNVSDGSDLTVGQGGTLTTGENSEVNVTEGSKVTVDADATVKVEEGATVTIDKDSSVKNSGTIDNDGTLDVDGSLENTKDATIANGSGSTIKGDGDVVNNGTLDNQGTVKNDITGDGAVEGEVTWTDASGNKHTSSLADALEELAKNPQNGITITVNKDATIDRAVTVPDGVTIEVKNGSTITIADGGSLKAEEGSSIHVEDGAAVDIAQGGALTVEPGASMDIAKSAEVMNDGTVEIDGTLNNRGTLTNDGSVAIDGALNNSGVITNDGALEVNGTLDNSGSITNGGTVNIDGTLDNSGAVTNKNGSTITTSGTLTNDGTLTNESGSNLNVNRGGEVVNNSTLSNSGNVTASKGSTLTNSTDSTLTNENGGTITTSGSVTNNGTLTNEDGGSITTNGTMINDGVLDNSGDVSTGSKGTIANGKDATITNNNGGSISGDKPIDNAGRLNNDGAISTDVDNTKGGTADHEVTWTDAKGNSYTGSFEKAMEYAKNNTSTDVTIALDKNMTIDSSIALPSGTTLKVPDGIDVTITDGGSITAESGSCVLVEEGGSVDVGNGGSLNTSAGSTVTVGDGGALNVAGGSLNVGTDSNVTVATGGSVEVATGSAVKLNAGSSLAVEQGASVNNNGTLMNNGSVTSAGTITNGTSGKINNTAGATLTTTGSVVNAGILANSGTIANTGSVTNDATATITGKGTIENNGSMENNGSIAVSGTITGSAEIAGDGEIREVVNKTITRDADVAIKEDTDLSVGEGSITVILESVDKNYETTGDIIFDVTIDSAYDLMEAAVGEDGIIKVEEGDSVILKYTVVKAPETTEGNAKEQIVSYTQGLATDEKNYVVGEFLDITLSIKGDISDDVDGAATWKAIKELNKAIRVSIQIPDELKGKSNYYIIRNHDGVCDTLADLDDDPNTITFDTDRFSTYAIAYEEVEDDASDLTKEPDITNGANDANGVSGVSGTSNAGDSLSTIPKSPKTGEDATTDMMMFLMLAAAGALVSVAAYRKKA